MLDASDTIRYPVRTSFGRWQRKVTLSITWQQEKYRLCFEGFGSNGLGTSPPRDGQKSMLMVHLSLNLEIEAGIGIIARDSEHQVIFMAWRVLFRCQDALEAEARACLEGLRLSAQWS